VTQAIYLELCFDWATPQFYVPHGMGGGMSKLLISRSKVVYAAHFGRSLSILNSILEGSPTTAAAHHSPGVLCPDSGHHPIFTGWSHSRP
jgi:hypothetical protein